MNNTARSQKKRALDRFLSNIKTKYLGKEFKYFITSDGHLIDRMEYRGIENIKVSKIMTKVLKHHICEVIYYGCMGTRTLYFKDNDLVLVVNLKQNGLILKTAYYSSRLGHITYPVIDVNTNSYNSLW